MGVTMHQLKENQDFLGILYKKAWEDPSFIEALKQNPLDSIKEHLGRTLQLDSGKSRIEVSDQTDSNIVYLNIPAKVNFDNLELTEEELELVAGGWVSLAAAFAAGFVVGMIAEY
ncbi:class IIb bacteriocin, lactobin A/cerein 7B family [Sungkyunkwania multivorans]|uniref:Class IIb bacteriocin, lactobin A/cerein 7B family n=1 Tax=Sungkyunkwania multivorans TaxID=1173618 RepID=A0ABW3D1E1_9FLAO